MILKKQYKTLIKLFFILFFIWTSIFFYYFYASIAVSNPVNSELRNLASLRAGINTLYRENGNYAFPTAISATIANQARITPEEMIASPSTITNSFGGVVTIAPQNLGTGINNGFRIAYPQVPSDLCIKLITKSISDVQFFDQVTIAGTVVKNFGANTVDPVLATVQCNTNIDNGVTMLFDSL